MNKKAGRKLEICCYTAESAVIADKAGADRIELCDNFSEGGTTPSYASIAYVLETLTIPVNVIIRPRGGDFLFSDVEFELIKRDVLQVKKMGANGVVVGFLTKEGAIDLNNTREIIDLAAPMDVTFHRAFDMCKDPFVALEQLKTIGVHRILTSGGHQTAMAGSEILSELVKRSGDEIVIMPGGGINPENLELLLRKTGATEFHSSAKLFIDSAMEYLNPEVQMGNKNSGEYRKITISADAVKQMKAVLDQV